MNRLFWILAAAVAMGALFSLAQVHAVRWTIHNFSANQSPWERRFIGQVPKCPDCNVILISLDTLRADRALQMPNLNAISEKSVVFNRAYANGYFTTPSHMSVFTSLYPATHRVETKVFGEREASGELTRFEADAPVPLDAKYVTWAELMRRSGYETYWNAPLNLRYLSFAYGFDRGFNHFAPSPFARGVSLKHFPLEGFNIKSLAPLKSGKKSFLFLHSYIAHGPYIVNDPTGEFANLMVPYNERLLDHFAERIAESPEFLLFQSFGKMPSPEVVKKSIAACINFDDLRECFDKYSTPDGFWHAVGQLHHRKARREVVDFVSPSSAHELEMYQKSYTHASLELDRQIGQLWNALKESGALNSTLVVFFSDHGESLLERGEIGHGSFFDEVARIPMLIYHPKLKEKIHIPQTASLVDLLPAVLEILDIAPPPQVQGRVPWINPREFAFGSTLGSDYITDGRWKLIHHSSGAISLYDLSFDPDELKNLSQSWHPQIRRVFERLLVARRMAAIEQAL